MGKQTNEQPVRKTKATSSENTHSNDSALIVWPFAKIDRSGKFAFDVTREDFNVKELADKLAEFSTMKWSELFPHNEGKSNHHLLSESSLSKEAKNRIKIMKLEQETDSIFSLRLNSKTRLIGIRDASVFQVVWYDSNHEFAPVKK